MVLPGCSLYFGSSPGSSHDVDAVPDGSDLEAIARPCIRAMAAGNLVLGGADDIFLTYVCDAPGAGGIIEYFHDEGGMLVGGMARADYQEPFIRATVVDADANLPADVLTVNQYNPGGWVFSSYGGFRYETQRPFTDAFMANIDGIGPSDLIFAGDHAIRVQHGMFAMTEPELLTGKPFVSVAMAPLGGSTAQDLFYIAGAPGQALELGVALQTAADPLAFTLGAIAADPAGPVLPLVVADVDGDHVPDVVGGTSHVFVRSSKTGSLSYLEETPSAIAAGDLDADGTSDAIFMTADHQAIRRLQISSTGQLSSSPLVAAGGDALTIADLDGDRRGDVILIRDLGKPTSTLVVHRATTY